jgi:hypothetical protein
MSDYDADILIWSERQGELLRRRAARRAGQRSRTGLAEHRRGDRGRGAQRVPLWGGHCGGSPMAGRGQR